MMRETGKSGEYCHPLKVAVFLDGSPGHEKQTLGIVKALQRLHPLEVREIKVPHKSPWQDAWAWIRYFSGMDFQPEYAREQYDLLIGTGAHTHIPMLSCKRHSDALCVTCMSPSRVLLGRFDICFIPQHDDISAGGNIVITVGPPNCSESEEGHDRNKALILVGGVDTKSHHWSSTDIGTFIRDLVRAEKRMEWTISSSPRTPMETVTLIEKMTDELDHVKFFRYENTEPGWIEKQYSMNGTVWVTADSMSMVYEALSAGCRVGILPVAWKNENNKFKRSEKYLLDHGLVVSYKAWKEGAAQWNANKPLHEAGRCADEILRKWYQRN
jgi:uncharacterized protein